VKEMTKQKIGLSMLFCLGKPFSTLCQRLQNLTIQNVELIDEGWHSLSQERLQKLKEIGQSQNLSFTLHAPFANINIAALSREMRVFAVKRLQKSIAFAKKLECHTMIFHPGVKTGINDFYPSLGWKLNIESTRALMKLSEEHGVRIAIENCPAKYRFLVSSVEEFSHFFDELESDLGLVLDVGHSNIDGTTYSLIKRFGEKIVHIHAHDNDGKQDLHLGIGYGTINWRKFANSIKGSGFNGSVIVESYHNIDESVSKLQELFA
jgi:sugar phosphate isomerase/epimerase